MKGKKKEKKKRGGKRQTPDSVLDDRGVISRGREKRQKRRPQAACHLRLSLISLAVLD